MGRFPFNNAEPSDKYFKILLDEKVDHYRNMMIEFAKTRHAMDLSPEFIHLIIEMLDPDPKQRPTIEMIKNHPWIWREFDTEKVRKKLIFVVNNKIMPKIDWRQKNEDGKLIDDFCSGHGKTGARTGDDKDQMTKSYEH